MTIGNSRSYLDRIDPRPAPPPIYREALTVDEQKGWNRKVLATIIVKMAAIPELMTPEHEKIHYRQRFRKRKGPASEGERDMAVHTRERETEKKTLNSTRVSCF
jgi:hypothetical protein